MPLPHRNKFQQDRQKQQSTAERPHERTWNVGYGRVMEVDDETFQVKVQLFDGTMVGHDPKVGNFIPLVTDISEILMRYGPLRKNLVVRVMWRGQQPSRGAVAEVIGEEDADFVKQLRIDKGGVGAFRIFSPMAVM